MCQGCSSQGLHDHVLIVIKHFLRSRRLLICHGISNALLTIFPSSSCVVPVRTVCRENVSQNMQESVCLFQKERVSAEKVVRCSSRHRWQIGSLWRFLSIQVSKEILLTHTAHPPQISIPCVQDFSTSNGSCKCQEDSGSSQFSAMQYTLLNRRRSSAYCCFPDRVY